MSDTEPTAEHVLTTLDERLVGDLRAVDVLVTDVDGVLTDGAIVMDAHGGETMRFHVRDGSGIWMLSRAGVRIALLTGRSTGIPEQRAGALPIAEVVSGCRAKGEGLAALLDRMDASPTRCAYIGDDLLDGPALRLACVPIAVADASPEILPLARYVTRRKGGDGALREVADLLLAARGAREPLLDELLGRERAC